MTVRVRFAPSPTGYLHIGGLRTMLYNFFFARRHGGALILRIEDTDQERSVAGGVEAILKIIKDMGLEFDEGPIIQSKRLKIYREHADRLVAAGRAFPCWCSSDELDRMREEQSKNKQVTRYDGRCLKLTDAVRRSRAGDSHVIRLRVPEVGETSFKDLIRGEVTFKNDTLDHTVLLKSDGFPTYHLANVVDDHLMLITHVIRGEEWISSTPKHVLLYQAFDWQPPQFAHLPLLLNSDRSKLSKRQMDVAVEDYLAKGYLPEALINFVSLLGWNPSGDQEIYTREELIRSFDLSAVNKSGAVINLEKLNWMNNHYIRQLSTEQVTNLVRPYLESAGYRKISDVILRKIVALEQNRLEFLAQFPEATSYFFTAPHYEPQILMWKKSSAEVIKARLGALRAHLSSLDDDEFETKALETSIKDWITASGYTAGEVLSPFRVALTGRPSSPPPFDIAAILGKTETLERIDKAIKML